jgi:uncharacterized membrane protein
MVIVAIFSRWLHLISACLLIGGVLFFRLVVPRGLKLLEESQRMPVLLAIRRGFKMIAHSAILFLLLSGIYNTVLAWDKYKLDKAVLHALWGTHILLAGLAITLSLYVLAGKQPPKSHRRLMALNIGLLLLVVAAASSLKWARERAEAEHASAMDRSPPAVVVLDHP